MRNILLIAIDTLRPDHLGCYGYGRPTSPCIDGFAEHADLYTQCWSASNFTAPAFTSLFSGLYPNHHGVFDFASRIRFSPVHQALTANDARIGGVVSFRFFRNLLEHIWGDIEAVTDGRSYSYDKELPRAVSDGAIEWLQAHDRKRPFALFLHYDGPHQPIRLPAPYADHFGDVPAGDVDPRLVRTFYPQERERFADSENAIVGSMFRTIESIDRGWRRLDASALQWLIDRYDDAVRYNDAEVGRVLRALTDAGLAEETVVAIISDHGEELMEHGHLCHGGIHLYESTIRTVAIVRNGLDGMSRRCTTPISHVQLLPWLLRLAGADHLPEAWRRLDLAGGGEHGPIFCVGEFKCAVRLGDWKYIRRRILPSHSPLKKARLSAKLALMREWRDELYDLVTDPAELHNRAGERGTAKRLAACLSAHLASRAPTAGRLDGDALSAEQKRRIEEEMRALGYM